MPMMSYVPKTYNDTSSLTPGWHPAFLLDILTEPTRPESQRYARSPMSYRWRFAVWEVEALIFQAPPERQSHSSSTIFNPSYSKGGNRINASTAFKWTEALLQRQIQPAEEIDLLPLMPIACRVKVERRDSWANIVDVEACPDLQKYLTPEFRAKLAEFLTTFGENTNQPAPAAAPAQQPAPAPQAGMQQWGNPAPQTPPPASTGTALKW